MQISRWLGAIKLAVKCFGWMSLQLDHVTTEFPFFNYSCCNSRLSLHPSLPFFVFTYSLICIPFLPPVSCIFHFFLSSLSTYDYLLPTPSPAEQHRALHNQITPCTHYRLINLAHSFRLAPHALSVRHLRPLKERRGTPTATGPTAFEFLVALLNAFERGARNRSQNGSRMNRGSNRGARDNWCCLN